MQYLLPVHIIVEVRPDPIYLTALYTHPTSHAVSPQANQAVDIHY